MIAFHGYGQDRRVFRKVAQQLSCRYTLYSIDLFFHGSSSWLARGQPLPKTEWYAIMWYFLEREGITNFSLMGYSMGARFALTLVECFAPRIRQVILIAPDGIRPGFWYRFASATTLGNLLLRTAVTRPSVLFTVIKLARRSRVADKSILKFITKRMDTRKRRYAVYCRWTLLRKIKPDLRVIVQHCNQQAVSLRIYVGQYDQIVKATSVVSLHKRLIDSTVYYLPTGHNGLIREAARHLAQELSGQ